MFHRQIQGPMACQPMGRNGSLEFKVEMIHDCGCGEDYSNDQDMSMYDEDASVALDDLLVDGKAVSEANKGLATMARTNHNLLGGGNEACFSLDNDESWDDLLLCEAYHYQSNSHITETMLNESVPQQPEKIELEMESSAHRAKQQQAPPLRELLKQRSSRRMLMESARQFSSRRLLLPSMDRCSSRSLLLSAADRCSSRSLLSDILCKTRKRRNNHYCRWNPHDNHPHGVYCSRLWIVVLHGVCYCQQPTDVRRAVFFPIFFAKKKRRNMFRLRLLVVKSRLVACYLRDNQVQDANCLPRPSNPRLGAFYSSDKYLLHAC